MKRGIILALTAILLVGLGACKKDSNGNGSGGSAGTEDLPFIYNNLTEFPADANTFYQFAPVGQYLEPYSGSFASQTEQYLQDKGYTKNDVVSIKGDSLSVTITNNPGQNFDFMDSIRVYVDSANGTGANRILFAKRYAYPTGLRTLELELTGADVKDVFRADSVKMTFGGTKRAGSHTIMANTKILFRTRMIATVNLP